MTLDNKDKTNFHQGCYLIMHYNFFFKCEFYMRKAHVVCVCVCKMFMDILLRCVCTMCVPGAGGGQKRA